MFCVLGLLILDLDPKDSVIYSLLADICAHEGRLVDVRMVKNMMSEEGCQENSW